MDQAFGDAGPRFPMAPQGAPAAQRALEAQRFRETFLRSPNERLAGDLTQRELDQAQRRGTRPFERRYRAPRRKPEAAAAAEREAAFLRAWLRLKQERWVFDDLPTAREVLSSVVYDRLGAFYRLQGKQVVRR